MADGIGAVGEGELLTRREGDDRGKGRVWEGFVHCRWAPIGKPDSASIVPAAILGGFHGVAIKENDSGAKTRARGDGSGGVWLDVNSEDG